MPLPKLRIPTLSPVAELVIAFALAIVAFVAIGYWAINLSNQKELVNVVAASHDLSSPSTLTAADLTTVQMPRGVVPATAITTVAKVVGSTLARALSKNQIVTTNELAGNIDPALLGLAVPANLKGFSLPNTWLASPLPSLHAGDTVTIIVSGAGDAGAATTGIIASSVSVLRTPDAPGGVPDHVLLGLSIEQSVGLLHARASNLLLHVLVDPLKATP